jgi:signal transduction histidine kinase
VWNKSQNTADDYTPEISISVSSSEDTLLVTIADNGEGMTDEVKQRLFENFFTTKPIGQGTGLGMSITRDIIENKHGGKISFTSTEGRGTTFTFTIPVKK